MTCLSNACVIGDIEHVRSLIDSGADIESDSLGYDRPPLYNASEYGHLNIVKLLIDFGADIEAHTGFKCTSLHTASHYGHEDIVKVLVDSGADIDARDCGNWTPLHRATANGQLDIVRLLYDRGADIEAKTYENRSVKQLAANATIKEVFEAHEHMIELKEWRPWNHSKYPSMYQYAMKTLVLLAKAY